MRLALWMQQLEPVNRFIDSINTAFGVLADQAIAAVKAFDKVINTWSHHYE